MKPSIELPCLCLVTDRGRVARGGLVEMARAAVDGGVGMVQLREKDMPAGELLALARELRGVTEGKALLVVNDRVDIAMLSGADGVQLGENGLDVASARRLVGADMVIGRSVHSVEGAVKAEADGADFLVLGTIFETASHPGGQTGGLGLVREVSARVNVPIIGIGGITAANAGGLGAAGAAGAAVITAVSMAREPEKAALQLLEAMRGACSVSRSRIEG